MSRPKIGNKRQRLIDSAVALFAEKGFHNTTTAEVSAHAGVAAGTLYLYFESKSDLLVASLGEFLDEFEQIVLPSAHAGVTAQEKVALLVRESLAFVGERPHLARVFLIELRQNGAPLDERATQMWRRYYDMVSDFLREASVDDGFPDDSDTATTVVLGVFEMMVSRWLLGNEPLPCNAEIGSVTAALLRSLKMTDGELEPALT